VAKWEANEEAVRAATDAPNYAARVEYAELMGEARDAKLARAEEGRDAAREAADAAELEAERTKGEAETAREELATAEAALELARAKLAAIEETQGFVNVLTAGDDKVCQICLDLAATGPYSPEEAEGMLPAHP